jgi:hypothetical protein
MTDTEKLEEVRKKIWTFDELPRATTARSRNKSEHLQANARMVFYEARNLQGFAVQDDVQYLFEAVLQVAEQLIDAAIKARSGN